MYRSILIAVFAYGLVACDKPMPRDETTQQNRADRAYETMNKEADRINSQ